MSASAFALVTGKRLWSSVASLPSLKTAARRAPFSPFGLGVKPKSSLALAARQSAIFEISLLCCVSHYKHIGLCLMRNLFQTFRPLLITIVMGNLLKIGAFLLQFPIGFYAIFFFEAFYGIMQLAISFVFVCFFHNGMMMQRSRVLSRHWFRMMRAKMTNAATRMI
jgi:hypothetical protein